MQWRPCGNGFDLHQSNVKKNQGKSMRLQAYLAARIASAITICGSTASRTAARMPCAPGFSAVAAGRCSIMEGGHHESQIHRLSRISQ
jgi:hypothetical protein